MCLAILSLNKKIDNKVWLKNGFTNNDHGAGFAYAVNGELIVEKGFFTFDDFYAAYEKIPDVTNVVHFRLNSKGKTNSENCHPFSVNSGLCFIHNGTLDIKIEGDLSDTNTYNKEIFQPLIGKSYFIKPALEFVLNDAVVNNKIVFLNKYGKHWIINEKLGDWIENGTVWMSNNSYKFVHTSKIVTTFKNLPTLDEWVNEQIKKHSIFL